MVPPTGRQLTIAYGEMRAVVVEVGAGVREYVCGDRALLDGYGEGEMASGRRGVPLLPWPNRIADGRYRFRGEELQLPITQVGEHNAIHGLTSFVAWRQVEETAHRVELAVPARTFLETDGRGIPTGRRPVQDSGLDFRRGRPPGAQRLDHCFTDLERSGEGKAHVRFGDLELWMDAAYAYVMVFSGDTLAEPRRRRGLAIEPMTCPANAFQTGESLLILEPGAAWQGRWGLKLRTP